jgi:hypothetical protein
MENVNMDGSLIVFVNGSPTKKANAISGTVIFEGFYY